MVDEIIAKYLINCKKYLCKEDYDEQILRQVEDAIIYEVMADDFRRTTMAFIGTQVDFGITNELKYPFKVPPAVEQAAMILEKQELTADEPIFVEEIMSIGDRIITALQEFTTVLESGESLDKHFRVTTVEKVNHSEYVITVKEPQMMTSERKCKYCSNTVVLSGGYPEDYKGICRECKKIAKEMFNKHGNNWRKTNKN